MLLFRFELINNRGAGNIEIMLVSVLSPRMTHQSLIELCD